MLNRLTLTNNPLQLFAGGIDDVRPTFWLDAHRNLVFDPESHAGPFSESATLYQSPRTSDDSSYYEISVDDFRKALSATVSLLPPGVQQRYMDCYPHQSPIERETILFENKECRYPADKFRMAVFNLPDNHETEKYQSLRNALVDVGGQPIRFVRALAESFHVLEPDLPTGWKEGWWYAGEIIKPCLVSPNCRT